MAKQDMQKMIMESFSKAYADNEQRWKESLSLFAALYVKEFRKSLKFIYSQLEEMKKITPKTYDADIKKFTPLLRIIDVRQNISNDKEAKKYIVNVPHFKAYELLRNREEVASFNNAANELNKLAESKDKDSFKQLNDFSNFIIAFINSEEVRKEYFRNALATPGTNFANVNELMGRIQINKQFSQDIVQIM